MERIEKRDIIDYEKNYSNAVCGFEKYKVFYRKRKIVEIIEQYSPQSILEIGCGMEPLFCYVKGDQKFTIVEPAEKFCENAKQLSVENKNVTCIKGFFEEEADRLCETSFDMVICSSLLHEVKQPEKLLNAIKKVCNSKTVIHINVPNMFSIHRLLGVEMGIISDIFEASDCNRQFQQNTNFDIAKLKTMMETNGLKVIEEGSFFVKPFSHKQMEDMVEKHIIDETVLDGLYKLTEYMPQFGSEIYVNCIIK